MFPDTLVPVGQLPDILSLDVLAEFHGPVSLSFLYRGAEAVDSFAIGGVGGLLDWACWEGSTDDAAVGTCLTNLGEGGFDLVVEPRTGSAVSFLGEGSDVGCVGKG